LSIYFNGNVGSKIKQNENEFLNFIELIKKNENIIILNDNKIGINLINVSGISNEDKILSIYFIDGSKKIFKSLNFKDIEKQILGEWMSQIFNLRGNPINNIPEVRTNLIKDQSGKHLIMKFDPVANSANLYNVDFIHSSSGTLIKVDNIVLT